MVEILHHPKMAQQKKDFAKFQTPQNWDKHPCLNFDTKSALPPPPPPLLSMSPINEDFFLTNFDANSGKRIYISFFSYHICHKEYGLASTC